MQMKTSILRVVIFSTIVIAFLNAGQLGAADAEVSGVFKGNDQPAKLAFVSAQPKKIMPKINRLI